MPRRQRPLNREATTFRDATLIVIASEDTYAVETYFSVFEPRRVQFKVIPTEGGKSSPKDIVERLDRYREEYQVGEGDELWYCGDIDHWNSGNHLPNLRQVLSYCHDRKYLVALSNPCFELWILLHFQDPPSQKVDSSNLCEMLQKVAGGYSKAKGCRTRVTEAQVRDAIERAKAGDRDDSNGLPVNPATRVWRILRSMIDRESIVLR